MSDRGVATGPCDAPGCGRSEDGIRYRWAKKPELAGKQECTKTGCRDWGGNRDLDREKAARQAKAAAAKAEKDAAKAAEAAEHREQQAQAASAAFAAAAAAPRFTSFNGAGVRGASMRAAATAAPAAAPQAATPPAAPAAAPTLACYRAWEQLSAAEQATASSLGFKQWKWDASVLGLDDDVNEGIPRLRAYPGVLREAGLGLLDVYAILGKRLHNPVDMTVLQRGSQLADMAMHPCFLVRGKFFSYVDPGNLCGYAEYMETRWITFDHMAEYVFGGSEGDPEFVEEFTRATGTYDSTYQRLWENARAKAAAQRAASVGLAAPAAAVPAAATSAAAAATSAAAAASVAAAASSAAARAPMATAAVAAAPEAAPHSSRKWKAPPRAVCYFNGLNGWACPQYRAQGARTMHKCKNGACARGQGGTAASYHGLCYDGYYNRTLRGSGKEVAPDHELLDQCPACLPPPLVHAHEVPEAASPHRCGRSSGCDG